MTAKAKAAIQNIQKTFITELGEDQGRVATCVYLGLAFNPKRKDVCKDALLNFIGLDVKSQEQPRHQDNLRQLKIVIEELKEDSYSTRLEILKSILDMIAINIQTDSAAAPKYTVRPGITGIFQMNPYAINPTDISTLMKVCEKNIVILERQQNATHKGSSLVAVGGFGISMAGGFGGYIGGKAAVGALVAYGASIPASLGVSLIVGATIIAGMATLGLLYIGYRLVNYAISNYEYNQAVKSPDKKLTQTVQGFMDEYHPQGDLPNLVKSLTPG